MLLIYDEVQNLRTLEILQIALHATHTQIHSYTVSNVGLKNRDGVWAGSR